MTDIDIDALEVTLDVFLAAYPSMADDALLSTAMTVDEDLLTFGDIRAALSLIASYRTQLAAGGGDLPTRFENWWENSKFRRSPTLIGYGDKKCLAFAAYEAGAPPTTDAAIPEGFVSLDQFLVDAAKDDEIERLRGSIGEIIQTVEDEAYKITAGQKPCKHTAALNEIHEIANAALLSNGGGNG